MDDKGQRRALFAEMLRRSGVTLGAEELDAPRGNVLPLSDQERRILKDARDPERQEAYNNGILLRLQGPLDLERLQRDLDAVVARHEAWRTSFVEREGVLSQEVHDVVNLVMVRRELRTSDLLIEAQADQRRPFDLHAAPLVRAFLYRLGEDDHALLVVAHHVVCDGWTVRLVMAELAARYNGRDDAGFRLPAVQYREYSARQQRWLAGAEAQAQKVYWERRLSGMVELELRKREGATDISAGEVSRQLSRDVPERLSALARGSGFSAFSVYVSALYLALVEITGETDITIGTPMHNRLSARDKLVFGCCVNLQPLRIDSAHAGTRHDTLRVTWDACREAFENQSLCVSTHVLSKGYRPALVFELLSEPVAGGLHLDGVAISVMPLRRLDARYDVQVIVDVSKACAVSILYRESRLDPHDLLALADSYERMLRELASHADR